MSASHVAEAAFLQAHPEYAATARPHPRAARGPGRPQAARPPARAPPGWYLPDVAARRAELDSIDIVEGLVIKGGPHVEVLNAISLHGGLVGSWPMAAAVTAKAVVEALVEHWRAVGLPGYAQFDNDTIFQGPHQHKDVVGRVMRLCLGLGVVPVFAPPRETGFQATIESFNGRWQAKVWARFTHESLEGLAARRAGTWPRPGYGPRRGSRRPRPAGRSPRAGSWTCRPSPAGGSSICGGPVSRAASSCWAGASR